MTPMITDVLFLLNLICGIPIEGMRRTQVFPERKDYKACMDRVNTCTTRRTSAKVQIDWRVEFECLAEEAAKQSKLPRK